MNLYFSAQQKQHSKEFLPMIGRTFTPCYGKLEDERVVEYTEMTDEGDEPIGNFNDYILLGKGDYLGYHLDIADEIQMWASEQYAEDSAWD